MHELSIVQQLHRRDYTPQLSIILCNLQFHSRKHAARFDAQKQHTVSVQYPVARVAYSAVQQPLTQSWLHTVRQYM